MTAPVREACADGATGAGGGEDPRVAALRTAVGRLRAELDAYPPELRDRHAAEDVLDRLAALLAGGDAPDVPTLRHALLLIAAAVGSVSALSEALTGVRHAVELFGDQPDQLG